MASGKRQHREYERTCDCKAYPFPHRLFGGRCTGLELVEHQFTSNQNSDCDTCNCNTGYCQVLMGQENTKECPALQEFSRYEGVKLPIKWHVKRGLTLHRAV